jgi:NADPH:quinone reductase-like Zn-dependent oxidoreductase
MKSVNVYFVGPEQVEVREEQVRDPGPGEVLIKAETSLISTGTELICYARRVEAGSHWDQWVQYPFQPGYSHVGTVVAAGDGVKELEVGTRVATRRPHHQYVIASAASALPVPERVSSSDATWF